MRKMAYFIFAVCVILSFSALAYADDFELIGREISPGIDLGNRTVGALFVGKFFYLEECELEGEAGRFTVILDHNGVGIEECGESTHLLRFKIIMNFNSGAKLVLLGPTDGDVFAIWGSNDPACEDGNCPIINGADYLYYIDLFGPEEPNPVECSVGGNAYIAEVPEFHVRRQWFGSWGTRFTGGTVNGYLVHTPIISPAIFGSLAVN
jgi:hypothetical protein